MTVKKSRKRMFVLVLLTLFITLGGVTVTISGQTRFFSGGAENYCTELIEKGFPEDYAIALTELHLLHPTWSFTPLLITKDEPSYTWNYVLEAEQREADNNLIYSSKTYSAFHHPSNFEIYDSSYRQVSEAGLEYFMDPRNFLNETDIFQFFDLSTVTNVSIDSVSSVLKGTFMENSLLENGKSYAEYFLEVGEALNVNPVYLAVKVRQEQGIGGISPVISGECGTLLETYFREQTQYTESGLQILPPSEGFDSDTLLSLNGYYNAFNINASGNGLFTIYRKAMERAKSGSESMKEAWGGSPAWDTVWKSIYGGALIIQEKYIGAYKNTIYLNKFNVDSRASGNFYMQYMQNVTAAMSEARTLYSSFAECDALDASCSFLIPVYDGMPTNPCPDPADGNVSSVAQATKKYGFEFDLVTPFYQTIQNGAIYVSQTITTLSSLTVSGNASHSYGVNSLEYRWDDGEWTNLCEGGSFSITFSEMNFSEGTEHILTIRGNANYDHSVSTKKSNRHFLCMVLYVNVVAPPQANVSYINRTDRTDLSLPVGGRYNLPVNKDASFVAWLGSDGSLLPSGGTALLETDISYTALYLERFEQLDGAALTFEDAGTRLCFYAAVEEKSFAALEKTHPSIGFFASLKKGEEIAEVELLCRDTIEAYGTTWRLLCAKSDFLGETEYSLPFSASFFLSWKYTNGDDAIQSIPAIAHPFTRTASYIANEALKDTRANYSASVLERLSVIADSSQQDKE